MKHSFIDKYSDIESPLHKIDPRIKIITFFFFIIMIVFTNPYSYRAFVLYGWLLFFLILSSRIPPVYIFKRSLTIIPFVLFISLFLPFLKGSQIAGGYSIGSLSLSVSHSSIIILWNIFIKAYLSVICLILLSSSTRFTALLKGFEKIGMPLLITMILSFMYRYIYIFVDELMRMYYAKESRSYNRKMGQEILTLSRIIGVLFVRAYERGERVYYSMCARGFSGKIISEQILKFKKADFLFLTASTILISLIWIFGSNRA